MAEALISVLIEELASLALQRVEEEVRFVKNVHGDVRKSKSNLEAIRDVLEDAEKRQLADLGVKNWLDKLKDVSFDMDNVMDKWSTALLKLKIEREGHEIVTIQTNKKVCFSVPSAFSYFTSKVNRITLCHDVAHKIKELNKKLDIIASEKERYKLNTTTIEQPLQRPKTTSFIDEAEIEGRDEENDILVSKLLCESSTRHGNKGLEIIPIVGMAGLGKTTLAQLAYNNEKVLAHFDKRIWVCVSNPFDEMKVAKAIVEAIEGNAPNTNELETVVQRVRKCIEGKRFLLILDDVWTKNKKNWEQLKQPLKYGAAGSRILVTTRKKEVAIMMAATYGMITLEKLSEEHCWLIFRRLAFLERKEEECIQLEEVGRKIASKCKGLPLVAKTLGSLMCFKKTKTQWQDVLNSELWKLQDVEELFAPFLLSYYDLSAKEKRCFTYCSVFPKDHRIQRNQLIEMWTSQSYLNSDNSEEEGRECFENLVMRSFFQNFEKNGSDGSITHCKMHDIVHDFAQYIAKNECITVEVDSGERKLKLLDEKARHLTLIVGSHAEYPAVKFNKTNEKNLRTLFIVSNRYDSSVDTSLILRLTCLRALTLTGCGLKKLPEVVGRLMHLRYLDLMLNPLVELPDSLCNLCNLQTLNLTGCYLLRSLPERMGKLVNLKHLYIGWCHALEGLPKGIGRLSLRTLDTLVIPENKGAYFDIEDLKMLKSLRLRGHLYLKGCGNLPNVAEAEIVGLKNSQHVVGLFYYFGKLSKQSRLEDDIAILEALAPHRNLERLRIEGYMGPVVSPKWLMSLINLRQLNLYDCYNCEILPSLGKLPCLEVFRTRRMKSVRKVDKELLGISERDKEDGATKRDDALHAPNPIVSFPKLETLDFQHLEQWEKWEGRAEETEPNVIMPCLRFLRFVGCPRLQALPDFLETMASLKELSICESEILEQCCQKRTETEWKKISHVPNIKVNDKYVRKLGIWIQEDDNVLEITLSQSECRP